MSASRQGRHAAARFAPVVVLAVSVGLAVAACSTRSSGERPTTTASATSTPTPSGTPSMTRVPAPAPVEIDKPPTGAPVQEPALRKELLAMLVQDQAVRTGVAPKGDSRTPDELAADWDETDRTNTARMAEVLTEHGWPGWRLVGSDGAFAAWVLVQHADLDLPLQERGLELMTAAVAARDADPSDHAYLVDRVRVAKGEEQVYGTQWGSDEQGRPQPRTPIEDAAMVDVRRAQVGLGTIDDYLVELAGAP
jgi:hypothetical protein